MSTADVRLPQSWHRARQWALWTGLAATVPCLLGALWSPASFFRAYVVAYHFWLGLVMGCLVLLLTQYLTGGGWGILLRRILEAASRSLVPLIILFIPILLGLRFAYPWVEQADQDHEFRQFYLRLPFFAVRAACYFAVWFAVSFFLNRWSAAQDQDMPQATDRLRRLSGPGLILYGATVTFASIDWVMSLEPDWVSTIFPPLYAVGQVLTGMAFAVLLLLVLAREPHLQAILRPRYLRDLGNLLLTFVMLWAYMAFSQFLLIWSENLPEEIPWYLRRTRQGWQIIVYLLIMFQFGLPFLLLLSRKVKESSAALAIVAGLVLIMRFLDVLWWIVPSYPSVSIWSWLFDLVTWIGIGGLVFWWFARELEKRPLLPLHEPALTDYLPEAVSHG